MKWGTDWFLNGLGAELEGFNITRYNELGDFGMLDGVDFSSDRLTGFIFFWDSKYLQFGLASLLTEEMIIDDTLLEPEAEKEQAIWDFLKILRAEIHKID